MDKDITTELKIIKEIAYDHSSLVISDFKFESEGKEYNACNFKINDQKVICRKAKITPKKIGQFVTFWRRNKRGITEPYHQTDDIGYYVINVVNDERIGQFVFPKSALIKNHIITSHKKDGKRGFRVYPAWDSVQSKQASNTQKWQLEYFVEFDGSFDLVSFEKLYHNK